MNSKNWKDIAELIGITAIVASLIFVGLQIRQDQNIALVQLSMESGGRRIELSQLMSENREAWEKGLRGEELSDLDYATFVSIANAYDAHIFLMVSRGQLLDTGIGEDTMHAYAIRLYAYPGLREFFNRKSAFRQLVRRDSLNPSPFRTKIQDHLAILDSERPSITDMQITF